MRISDWSSDVCSSDLGLAHLAPLADLFVHDGARFACAVLGQLRAVRDPQHRAGLHQVDVALDEGVGVGPQQRQHDLVERMAIRSEEHTSELQSLMRISYAVFCLKKKKTNQKKNILLL